MKRVIVDYAKLTNDILTLLVEKFPDGYEDDDVIRFRNAQNELIEAVEVRTEDTIYLVKISKKVATRMENFEDDEDIDEDDDTIAPVKGLDDDIEEVDVEDDDKDDIDDDDDVEVDLLKDKGGSDDDDDDDDDDDETDDIEDDEDEDED